MPLEQLGRYEIIEELGRGSMGIVYKARDPLLDRTVALKTVGLELSREETDAFERRFYREAKSAGRLNHSNIVTIHDVGKSDSVAYNAMEFLQGRSLRDILDSGVVLPVDRIVDIVGQVAEGLAFAHESGIVHRDIKPPNIMVLDSGVVKITDFGIALIPSGSRTLAGTVFGSPKYMSPEQVVGRQVDGRADIFSLGAVLYEMLTGFAPFFGGDLEAVLYQVINEMPAAPTSRNRALPAVFDYILARALAKHPEDRYGDARAFASDVRNFRELRPPIEPSPDQRTLERRAIRRRKGEIPPPAAAPVPAATQETAEAVDGSAGTSAVDHAPRAPLADARPQRLRMMLLIGIPAAVLFVGGATALIRLVSSRVSPAQPLPVSVSPIEPAASATPAGAPASPSEPMPLPVVRTEPLAAAPAASVQADRSRAGDRQAIAKPVARLALAVSPWGEVYVDGRKRGISPPLTELRLAPGRHTIEIRNAQFAPYAETVNLEANASAKIKHKFR